MKLVRYGAPGAERPGIWQDATKDEPARILDVQGMVFDIADYDARFWRRFALRGCALLQAQLEVVPAAGQRLGPPVAPPRQIICPAKTIATTYRSSMPGAELPVYFAKSPKRCAAMAM